MHYETDGYYVSIRLRTLVYKRSLYALDILSPLLLHSQFASRYASSPVVFAAGGASVVAPHNRSAMDFTKVDI